MLNELLGTATLVGSLIALVYAIRNAVPVVSKAFADHASSRLVREQGAAERKRKRAEARAAADAYVRARIDQCEQAHSARDKADRDREERDRKRDIEHAREVGMVRGQLLALRDEIQVLRTQAGHKSPEGQV